MDAVVKVWLNEFTLLQEQPKTAMKEAGVAWLDSCTCFDHCPGSLKDHARSGNYHPLATCWRHLASSFQCHWIECMRQALILAGKSQSFTGGGFSCFLHPGLHALHATSLHQHSLETMCVCVLLFLEGSVMRYHALALQEQPAAAMEEAGAAVWGPFFLLWLLSLILERSCCLWKSTLIRFCWLVFELIACGKRSFWSRNIPKLHWRRLRLFSGGLSPGFACSSCDITASTFSGDKVVFDCS